MSLLQVHTAAGGAGAKAAPACDPLPWDAGADRQVEGAGDAGTTQEATGESELAATEPAGLRTLGEPHCSSVSSRCSSIAPAT